MIYAKSGARKYGDLTAETVRIVSDMTQHREVVLSVPRLISLSAGNWPARLQALAAKWANDLVITARYSIVCGCAHEQAARWVAQQVPAALAKPRAPPPSVYRRPNCASGDIDFGVTGGVASAFCSGWLAASSHTPLLFPSNPSPLFVLPFRPSNLTF